MNSNNDNEQKNPFQKHAMNMASSSNQENPFANLKRNDYSSNIPSSNANPFANPVGSSHDLSSSPTPIFNQPNVNPASESNDLNPDLMSNPSELNPSPAPASNESTPDFASPQVAPSLELSSFAPETVSPDLSSSVLKTTSPSSESATLSQPEPIQPADSQISSSAAPTNLHFTTSQTPLSATTPNVLSANSANKGKKPLPKTTKILLIIMLVLVLIGSIVFGVMTFSSGFGKKKATTKPSSSQTSETKVETTELECEREFSKDELLDLGNAKSASKSLDLDFKNKKLDKMSEKLKVKYENEATAKIGLSKIINSRNSKWIDAGLKSDPFETTNSINDAEVEISRTISGQDLDAKSAKLTKIEITDDSPNLKLDSVKSAYIKAGFVCK